MDTSKLEKIVAELNSMKEAELHSRYPFETDEDDNYITPSNERKAFTAKMAELNKAIRIEVEALMAGEHTQEDAKKVGRIVGLRM